MRRFRGGSRSFMRRRRPFFRRRRNIRRFRRKNLRSNKFTFGKQIQIFARRYANFTTDLDNYDIVASTGSGVKSVAIFLNFKLSDVAGYAEFTSLFDRYKILGVQVKFITLTQSNFTSAPAGGAGVTGYQIPQITYAPDYDDASSETLAATLERSEAKTRTLIKPLSVYLKNPKVSSNCFGSGFYVPPAKSVWVDCVTPDVPHYGLKSHIWIQNNVVAPSQAETYRFKVIRRYYLKFQGMR